MMKILLFLGLNVFAFALATTLPVGSSVQRRLHDVRRIAESNDCGPNICFAIDGSGSISNAEFQLQKDFVQMVVAILHTDLDKLRVSALQYGDQISPISPRTQDINSFLAKLDKSSVRAFPRSSIGKAITSCSEQLLDYPHEPAIIIVIGDGRDNFGPDAVSISTAFKKSHRNGSISTVATGFANETSLKAIAKAGGGDLFAIDDFFEIIYLVLEIVEDACGLN